LENVAAKEAFEENLYVQDEGFSGSSQYTIGIMNSIFRNVPSPEEVHEIAKYVVAN